MIDATEVQKAHSIVSIVESIEVAEALLRSATADIRLRCHYEPKSEDYALLTEALDKHLGLAQGAVAQAQSAKSEIAEGLDFSALTDDASAGTHEDGHKAGSDGHAI